MPCHEEPYKPDASKHEVNELVLVVNGRIRIQEVGDDFHGKFPTVRELVEKFRKKGKTFNYSYKRTMLVIVSPCPKKC